MPLIDGHMSKPSSFCQQEKEICVICILEFACLQGAETLHPHECQLLQNFRHPVLITHIAFTVLHSAISERHTKKHVPEALASFRGSELLTGHYGKTVLAQCSLRSSSHDVKSGGGPYHPLLDRSGRHLHRCLCRGACACIVQVEPRCCTSYCIMRFTHESCCYGMHTSPVESTSHCPSMV